MNMALEMRGMEEMCGGLNEHRAQTQFARWVRVLIA